MRELAPKAGVATNRNSRFVTKYVIALRIWELIDAPDPNSLAVRVFGPSIFLFEKWIAEKPGGQTRAEGKLESQKNREATMISNPTHFMRVFCQGTFWTPARPFLFTKTKEDADYF